MAVQINGTTGITTPKLDALDLELGSRNVVERGSNANGEYVRFADGTQICTFSSPFSASSVVTWTYPAAFSSTPPCLLAASDFPTVPGYYFTEIVKSGGASSGSIYRFQRSTQTATADAFTIVCFAIGRWY